MILVWIRQILKRVLRIKTLKDSLLFALCLWAVSVQMSYRVPGAFPFLVLPWLGLVLTAISFLMLIVQLLEKAQAKDPLRRDLKLIQQMFRILVCGFILYSVFLYINCEADIGWSQERRSVVLDMSEGEFDLGSFVPYARADLRSWKDPTKIERVLLRWRENQDLWVKEPVLVKIHEGALGLPWLSAIEEDKEAKMLQVLKVAPTAAAAWKNLVWLYLGRERWGDAVKTAQEYFKYYPDDAETAHDWADFLFMYRQFSASLAILDPPIAHRPNFNLYILASWNLGQDKRVEDQERALQLVQAAIKMEPDNPVGYYNLGYIYYWMNRLADALGAFEKMLTMWPGVPDVEKLVEELRKQTATRKSAVSR